MRCIVVDRPSKDLPLLREASEHPTPSSSSQPGCWHDIPTPAKNTEARTPTASWYEAEPQSPLTFTVHSLCISEGKEGILGMQSLAPAELLAHEPGGLYCRVSSAFSLLK